MNFLNLPSQKVIDMISPKHPGGWDFKFSKQNAAEAIAYGNDLLTLHDACGSPDEFLNCLERFLLWPSKAELLMNIATRFRFMEKELTNHGITASQLVELLALKDDVRNLAFGLEVKGITLANLPSLKPTQIKAMLRTAPALELSTGEEILIEFYRRLGREQRQTVWQCARLMSLAPWGKP